LQKYLDHPEEICRQAEKEAKKKTAKNSLQLLHRENEKTIAAVDRLHLIYKRPVSKRGLIDAIGTISKMLLGTIDANDARIISEQMELTQSRH
jgi:hypothetical protein